MFLLFGLNDGYGNDQFNEFTTGKGTGYGFPYNLKRLLKNRSSFEYFKVEHKSFDWFLN